MNGTEKTIGDKWSPIRKFNPGMLQSDEEVIAQFVVRQHELGIVSEVLKSNIDAPSCQQVLVVAPRGQGKTMLLARVAAELRCNPNFERHLLPVRFMEESQEVYDLADFWLETLFHLSKEITADHPALAHELVETHSALSSRWREEGLEGIVRAAVLDAADRLHRRLVLIVENLQSLCESVNNEFGWQLRGVLQSDPQIMLLASATCRFEGLDDAGEPFFELFHTVNLHPLTTEQCKRLWTVVSEQNLSTREIRPLEILTGGCPRLLVVVAAFVRHRSIRQLMEELVSLVDEHTEYFRNHLESLPKNERRVYIALIDLWKPASTGEIAARARLDIRVVSTMLGRLMNRGAVIAEQDGFGKKRLYAASERLYSIYYKLRRERDEAVVVDTLIRFMVAFYDESEMFDFSEKLWRDAIESTAIHSGIERALASRPLDEDSHSRMIWDSVESASGRAKDYSYATALENLQNDINASIDSEDWTRVLDIVEQYVTQGWLELVSDLKHEENWVYLAHMRSIAHLNLNEFEQVVVIGNEVAERLCDTRDTTLLHRSCTVACIATEANLRLGNFETAISGSRKIIDRFGQIDTPGMRQVTSIALVFQAFAENNLGNYKSAIVLLNKVLDEYGDDDDPIVQRSVASAFAEKGFTVGAGLREPRMAVEVYDEAIKRFGGNEDAEIRKAMIVCRLNQAFAYGVIGDFENELTSYGELIASVDSSIGPEKRWLALIPMAYKSRRLAELGRVKEAMRLCDEYVQQINDGANDDCPIETQIWMDWHTRGTRALALIKSGDFKLALDAFRSAYTLFQPCHQLMIGEMLRLVTELITSGASERDLVSVFVGDSEKSATLQPINVALQQRAGESVRAPAEVLEVAADLLKYIKKRIADGVMPGFVIQIEQ